jgi:hypothetical protein
LAQRNSRLGDNDNLAALNDRQTLFQLAFQFLGIEAEESNPAEAGYEGIRSEQNRLAADRDRPPTISSSRYGGKATAEGGSRQRSTPQLSFGDQVLIQLIDS